MVTAYWLIGKRIVIEEQKGAERAGYGDSLLKNLSKELTAEFGNGFSYANLCNMRKFYQTYSRTEIFYTLCIKLSWSHNRLIMRIADPEARKWYLQEAVREQWSVRQLERNINTFYYQRHIDIICAKPAQRSLGERPISNQEKGGSCIINEDATPCGGNQIQYNIRQFIKDPYVLEFIGLPKSPEHTERDLEEALITHMQNFLLEMGKGFSFVKRQYRISTETSHYYIDLVFYNYILKCFFLVDLKAEKLTHQDVGQMDMYVRMYDELKKAPDDNPTIGIVLCSETDEDIARYSVLKGNEQLFASKYKLYLPTEDELRAEIENQKTIFELQQQSKQELDNN